MSARRISRKDVRDNEFVYRTIKVSRVCKTTSGGRRMSVSVLVVIGNQNGVFGYGLGNDIDMRQAEAKALKTAQNNLFLVPLVSQNGPTGKRSTVHQNAKGSWGASSVEIFRCKPGTSIVASQVVRNICDCIGITDIVAKCRGSSNPHNVLRAFVAALAEIKTQSYYVNLLKQNDSRQ